MSMNWFIKIYKIIHYNLYKMQEKIQTIISNNINKNRTSFLISNKILIYYCLDYKNH
jgi:hypothetical protein